MSVEIQNLQPGVKVRMKDGEEGFIRSVYMSPTGIVFTVKTPSTKQAERNVPMNDIVEIVSNG